MPPSKPDVLDVWKHGSQRLGIVCEEEVDGSMKLKEHVGWWEAELNENERRDFPSGPEMKRDQRRIRQCVGLKRILTELSGGRGQAC